MAARRHVVGVLALAARPPEPLLRAFVRAFLAPTTPAEKEAFEEDHILKLEFGYVCLDQSEVGFVIRALSANLIPYILRDENHPRRLKLECGFLCLDQREL